MKLARTFTPLVVAALTASILTACATDTTGGGETSAPIAATSIRLALGDPAGSAVANAAEYFAAQAHELSDGAVKVEVFPDGTLFNGDQNAAVNLLANGTLDATIISSSVYASFEPRMNAISLPFLFEDMDQYSDYLAEEPGQQLLSALNSQGIAGLTFLTRTPRVTTNSKHPIETPADFEGLKIRVPQNELWVKFFGSLGANPTPMDFKEVYTALQLGTIDGQENPVEVPVANKFFEVQDYLSLTNHISDAWVLAFNEAKFDGYSEDVQEVLRKAAAETAVWKRKTDDDKVSEILAELKAQGVQVNELSGESKKLFQESAQALYPEFVNLVGEAFMGQSLEYLGR